MLRATSSRRAEQPRIALRRIRFDDERGRVLSSPAPERRRRQHVRTATAARDSTIRQVLFAPSVRLQRLAHIVLWNRKVDVVTETPSEKTETLEMCGHVISYHKYIMDRSFVRRVCNSKKCKSKRNYRQQLKHGNAEYLGPHYEE